MKYTRLYTGDDQHSYFEDLSFDTVDTELGKMVGPLSTEEVSLSTVGKDDVRSYDLHNPEKKLYVVILEGVFEIETSLGDKRRFNPGDIFLAEDVEGRGHMSRAASEGDLRFMLLPLAA